MAVLKISAAGCVLTLICALAIAVAVPTPKVMLDKHFVLPSDRPVDGLVECSGGAAGDVHLYQVHI